MSSLSALKQKVKEEPSGSLHSLFRIPELQGAPLTGRRLRLRRGGTTHRLTVEPGTLPTQTGLPALRVLLLLFTWLLLVFKEGHGGENSFQVRCWFCSVFSISRSVLIIVFCTSDLVRFCFHLFTSIVERRSEIRF